METSQSLAQFDLLSNNIPSSKVFLFKSYYGIRALQLAVNNKIYYSSYLTNSLGVINNPNLLGLACNFNPEGQQLAPNTTHGKGLPPFVSSFFDAFFDAKNLCYGSNTEFLLNSEQTITAARWDFGDGTNSTDLNPTHTYPIAGSYTVTVTVSGSTGSTTKTKHIVISQVPKADQPQDILLCDDNNDGLHLFDLSTQNAIILNGQDPDLFAVNYFSNNVAIASPGKYLNTVPYQREIITAEVSNKANGDCKTSTRFNIDVFDTPLPNLPTAITNLTSCDNTGIGTDTDGKVIFDLTQKRTAILNGQSPSQFVISYFKDSALTQIIAMPNAYKNATDAETIFVEVINKDNSDCKAVTSFKLEVFALPVNSNVVDLKQCDDDIDGFSIFNLEEAINEISVNSAIEIISFHKTLLDAQNNTNAISNQTAYRNDIISIDKVYVRVANAES